MPSNFDYVEHFAMVDQTLNAIIYRYNGFVDPDTLAEINAEMCRVNGFPIMPYTKINVPVLINDQQPTT